MRDVDAGISRRRGGRAVDCGGLEMRKQPCRLIPSCRVV